MNTRTFVALGAAVIALGLAACGGGGSSPSQTPTGTKTTRTVPGSSAAHRGGTLTMLWSTTGSSIDPAVDYDANWFVLAMTNDGLTTWRRVGGPAGNQLVPDLAQTLPTPTNGGRTYTFQLRPGIHYSTGAPVKASDLRYAIEREFKIPGPGTTFYTGIVGGAACAKTPKACNLSKGIVTNDAAGTITFHLTRPDADFLDKLALPFASVVPAGTPLHDIGTQPVPATGPYMIKQYTPNQHMIFVRNPQFHQWSAAAQPDGYPDQIDMKIGLTTEDEVTQVENGQADWMYETPPPDRLQEIASRYPAQLHISRTPQVWYMAMNVNVPPFNNLKVRQALNLATDRRAVIGLFGGPRLGIPTCQILPPAFPGYSPYCPYTKNPGTQWTAPDLARAKALIDASGTKGTHVTIVATPDQLTKSVDLYFVSLLNQLGYPASIKTLSSTVQYPYVQDSSNKVQLSLSYWDPDYPAADDFLNVVIGCGGYHPNSSASPNLSGFCDPAIQAQTEHALEVQVTNPHASNALWAQIDRATTDQAPQVSLLVQNKLDFVSKRLGNYQFSPAVIGYFLIDQAWVK